ncbi:MAG: polysaccharide biosynthesis/export family protein [Candidatus Sulfotelmatobacter sp.]
MLAMISPGVAQTAINDDNSVRPGTLPSSNMPKTPNRIQDNVTPPDVLVSSGDLLAVGVLGAPDYHYDLRVSSSGEISLPMAGSMYVAGLTTPQAETTIAQTLQKKGFFNNPQVSVFVKEYSTSGTSVLGEVQHPGIYPLLGHRTLLDALSAAGGTTARAGRSVTITHRDHPEAAEAILLSSSDGQTMTNISVRPGDTIVVSKAGVVYVVGDVKEPTGIIMDNPRFTVLQAIAMAHGTNPTAAMSSAKLIRRVDGVPHEIPIPLNKILTAKSTDIALQADDIVFVPNSVAKTATRRGLEAALQAATGVAIYGRY